MIYQKKRSKNNIITIIILIITISLGFFFRFGDLDSKVFWHDEALTMSRTSGYYAKEINQEIFNGKLITVEELRKYQNKKPDRSILNIIDVLASDNPQHPPVYYLLLGLWIEIVGQSITSVRSLSALFSILVLLCVYLLWKELRQSSLVAGVSIAIITFSPFHVLYAQEAREYSLWAVFILISSISLLRAIKLKKPIVWLIYALVSLIGLYVFPFSLFLYIGHGIYLFILERIRLTRTLISFLLSFLFLLAGFIPWLILIIEKWGESGSKWTTIPVSFLSLSKAWGTHIYKIFFLSFNKSYFHNSLKWIIIISLLAFISYSFYLLIRQTHKDVWLFIIILTCIVFLPLAGADLILGGQRTVSSRYLIPSILGIQLSLSFGLAFSLKSKKIIIRKITQMLLIAIIATEIISCTINFQKNTAWNKGINFYLPTVAEIVNDSNNSLLITNSSGMNFGNILALSHLLDENISLILVEGWIEPDYQNVPKIPQSFDNIFFLGFSKQFENIIEKKYETQLKTIHYDPFIQLKKISID